jgi:uncharacterized protein (TIRG00374 family)
VKSKIIQILQYIVLLAIGIVLCYVFFNTLNIEELKLKIQTGNLSWLYLVFLVSLAVYVIRVLRWQMLIKSIGYETKFKNALAALSISYLVSFVVPRLGEVTRCLSVKKHHKIPFVQLFGTVIIERVVDLVSLIIVLFLTLILQFSQIKEFILINIVHPFYDGVIAKIIAGNSKVLILALVIIAVLACLFFYFRKYIIQKSPAIIVHFVNGLKQGLVSIAKLRQKKLFVFYTFLIWVCYFLMTYFWFFVFKETSVLGLGACLAILSIGTIGRSVPIQGGGMGAYHFLVANVVVLYGLTADWGKSLATLIHGGQMLFTFLMGLVGLIIFFIGYWRNR